MSSDAQLCIVKMLQSNGWFTGSYKPELMRMRDYKLEPEMSLNGNVTGHQH